MGKVSSVIKLETTQEMVNKFAVAWHDEDDKTNGDNYVTGNRRRAGIDAVIEIIKRDLREQGIEVE